jgi:hypothetical protein
MTVEPLGKRLAMKRKFKLKTNNDLVYEQTEIDIGVRITVDASFLGSPPRSWQLRPQRRESAVASSAMRLVL